RCLQNRSARGERVSSGTGRSCYHKSVCSGFYDPLAILSCGDVQHLVGGPRQKECFVETVSDTMAILGDCDAPLFLDLEVAVEPAFERSFEILWFDFGQIASSAEVDCEDRRL